MTKENKQNIDNNWGLRLKKLLGMNSIVYDSDRPLTEDEVDSYKQQADIAVEIFKIFKSSIEIM